MRFDIAFEKFIFAKRVNSCSAKSIKNYESFIYPFVEYIGIDKDTSDILEEDIQSYIMMIVERDISKSSKATYIRHIKCFLNWLKKDYDIDLFVKRIHVPKTYKKKLLIYSDDDILTIFNSINADKEWIVFRNRSIIALMLDSGLRQSEVCGLSVENIDFKRNRLKVCGKGNKERIVPLGSISKQFMLEYIKMCPFHATDTPHAVNSASGGAFFLSRHGGILTCNAVKLLMHKISQKLPFEFSSHKLRHNFATNYCIDQYRQNKNVDIYKLMILMGHEDIETTRVYLHHANEIIASSENISHLDLVFAEK